LRRKQAIPVRQNRDHGRHGRSKDIFLSCDLAIEPTQIYTTSHRRSPETAFWLLSVYSVYSVVTDPRCHSSHSRLPRLWRGCHSESRFSCRPISRRSQSLASFQSRKAESYRSATIALDHQILYQQLGSDLRRPFLARRITSNSRKSLSWGRALANARATDFGSRSSFSSPTVREGSRL